MRYTEGWQALLSTLGPLLGVLLGFLAAGRNEARRDDRAEKRAEQDRLAARDQARTDAVDAFERNILTETYERLSDLARAMARAHIEDEKGARLAGSAESYGSTPLGEELSQSLLAANREVYRLRRLMLAPQMRDAVAGAHQAANDVSASRNLHEADALYKVAVYKIDAAQSSIAERLRRLYVPGGDRVLADG